jgi:hypothetical protein
MTPAVSHLSTRRRPLARLPGLHATLECAETQDAIVRELCDGMSVSVGRLCAAVTLARGCAAVWADTARRMLAVGSVGMLHRLHAEDFQCVDRAAVRVTAVPDPAVMGVWTRWSARSLMRRL